MYRAVSRAVEDSSWLSGLFAVPSTPMLPGGALDLDSLDSLVDYYLAQGARGLVPVSVVGEGAYLNDDERASVIERVVARAARRVPIITGVLRKETQAADLEDSMDKLSVTPGAVVPARELLGDLLLDLGHPEQALAEYESVLKSSPRRFRSVRGAALAAERSGDPERARVHYEELDALAAHAQGTRPGLRDARAFLSRR